MNQKYHSARPKRTPHTKGLIIAERKAQPPPEQSLNYESGLSLNTDPGYGQLAVG